MGQVLQQFISMNSVFNYFCHYIESEHQMIPCNGSRLDVVPKQTKKQSHLKPD